MSDQQQIQIKVPDEKLALNYSNYIRVAHSAEEFVLELLSVYPPQGSMIARAAISPAHAKRLLKVLSENIESYEKQFGVIKEMPIPFNLGNMGQK
ncbi:MAG: hypothetical protein UX09_C0013G0016 [Candidatus Uhrbacteria bacterium GW2011_GWE2_45_35]|uniref:DUF3467 domain-containing protein n=2 Tax=Candidatus Uhriibacteriota TaxID=1752732 RepID=A0A0G1JJX3_9BACT|nr:MAG: hypothetical protein UW63_C0005G0014 [Candidatus Uhrbacteria bacterium GW2011_GWF2_44_350]KKU08773.1 MAG: hypothetical protein UX09_C0013G0016 [Candidatus Uhrbacteria bacterium GW2011_GWE2_45_35]HBR80317.1 DUF3467 domain-containing protein [Candidatus Uhrbacteria bacterium]HCU31839.1 DUF3467 domain-containing protein [Candidatus Uhrbacteria bacterium]